MALPPLFRRKDKAASPAPASAQGGAPVEAVRLRARRRLIGAVVLLGIGIVAFPLLFETAPRPIPVDLPIEIPRKDAVAPLAMPAPAPTRQASPAAPPAPRAEGQVEPAAKTPEPPPEPVREVKAEAPPKVEPVAEPKPAPKPETSKADEAARAKALLEGKPAAPAAGRWVVQIGAFAEDQTVRNVRAKAGKIGLQTFTQVVAVEAGERTRVRVGPFAERDEADAAAAKLKKAGLPASVLKL